MMRVYITKCCGKQESGRILRGGKLDYDKLPARPFLPPLVVVRAVAVVVYQHVKTCEWRRKVAEKREKAEAVEAATRGPAAMKV